MAKRIDVKDLNLFYGKFHAVDGVSLAVPPKNVTAFIGPSGCGKSTVLRSLNRMHEVVPGARAHGTVPGGILVDGACANAILRPHPPPDHLDSSVTPALTRPLS